GDAIDATRAREDVRWRSQSGVAWITLSKPAAGRWRFAPDTAAVRVLADLELIAGPNSSAEAPTLRVDVLDAGRPLDPALRDAVTLDAKLTTLYGAESLQVTPVDGAVAFDVALGSPLTADDAVDLRLAGPTFQRE